MMVFNVADSNDCTILVRVSKLKIHPVNIGLAPESAAHVTTKFGFRYQYCFDLFAHFYCASARTLTASIQGRIAPPDISPKVDGSHFDKGLIPTGVDLPKRLQ